MSTMKIFKMKIILFIILVISFVANGQFLKYYDRRVLLDPEPVALSPGAPAAGSPGAKDGIVYVFLEFYYR